MMLVEHLRTRWPAQKQVKVIIVVFTFYSIYTVMCYELLLSLYTECVLVAYIARIYGNFAICVQFASPKLIHVVITSFTYIVLHAWLVNYHVVDFVVGIGLGLVAVTALIFGWYVQPDRELSRF